MTKYKMGAWLLVLVGLVSSTHAFAQIAFRAAGAQAVSTSSSLTPAIPAGTQAGDFAVLVVAGRPNNTSQPAAPAGWTLRSSSLREVGSNDLRIVTYYRVLAGGDANPTLSLPSGWQGNSAGTSGQIAVWSGVNASSPFDTADITGSSAAAASWAPPTVSTVTAGAWVVSAVATSDDNALALGTPQGFTVRMTGASYDTTTGGDHSIGVADKLQASPGAPTMPTWNQPTHASDSWVSITFALRPPSGAAAGLYFIHPDHLNTPRAIYNDQQQLAWKWDQQEPFGNSPPNENPSGLGTFECNMRFPGQYVDKETNLSYNYFRDYDPGIGRYVESDPVGLEAGLNTYGYVAARPLRFIDPDGLQIAPPGGGTIWAPPGGGAWSPGGIFGPRKPSGTGVPEIDDAMGKPSSSSKAEKDADPDCKEKYGKPRRKRGRQDPIFHDPFFPGRNCDNSCKKCPDPETFTQGGHTHTIVWDQKPSDCCCIPRRLH